MGSPAARSRRYSFSSVRGSYSAWPVTNTCRPRAVAMTYRPARSDEARILSRFSASTSARRMPVWREWGAMNVSSKPRMRMDGRYSTACSNTPKSLCGSGTFSMP